MANSTVMLSLNAGTGRLNVGPYSLRSFSASNVCDPFCGDEVDDPNTKSNITALAIKYAKCLNYSIINIYTFTHLQIILDGNK